MDFPVRSSSPGAGSHAGWAGSLGSGIALLRLLERARNVEEIEELLLAAAVHPDGAGFSRARLLRFDPEHERLFEIRHAVEPHPALSLADCVQELRNGD